MSCGLRILLCPTLVTKRKKTSFFNINKDSNSRYPITISTCDARLLSKTYGSVPLRLNYHSKRTKTVSVLFSFFIYLFSLRCHVWHGSLLSAVYFLTVGSLVDRKIVNDGDKSISWSPIVIRTRPPVRRSSRFSTGFKIGS